MSSVESKPPECCAGPSPDRRRVGWQATAALGIALGIVLLSTIPCLPPSVCFNDPGDIQLAAWKLGIAHPPGYPIYSTILHVFTWLPGIAPAFAVSIGCLLIGVLALGAIGAIQIRLGANPWVAAAVIVR